MRINTNIASLNAQANNAQTNMTLQQSLEKLSSGLKINKAADDASGMAIADKLRTQASSIGQGIQNANSGSALIQIADKAMAEQSNILDIVKTKLLQAATSTTSAEGRDAIRKDIQKLLQQVDNISTQTTYNGVNLLNEQGADFNFQIGEKSTDIVGLTTAYAVNTKGLGSAGSLGSSVAEVTIDSGSSITIEGEATDTKITVSSSIMGTAGGIVQLGSIEDGTGNLTNGDSGNNTFMVSAEGVSGFTVSGSTGGITLTTENETLKTFLNSEANRSSSDSLSLAGDGSYVLKTTTGDDVGLSIFKFGGATGGSFVDITDLKISNLTVDTAAAAGSQKTMGFITRSDVEIEKLGGTADIQITSKDTTGQAASSTKEGILTAKISSEYAEGIDFGYGTAATDTGLISLTGGTIAVKSDNPSTEKYVVINAESAAANTFTESVSFEMGADDVQSLLIRGTGSAASVLLETDDAALIKILDGMTGSDLTGSNGTYTLQASSTDATGELTFVGGVDISSLKISGVDKNTVTGSEMVYVETAKAVSITNTSGTRGEKTTLGDGTTQYSTTRNYGEIKLATSATTSSGTVYEINSLSAAEIDNGMALRNLEGIQQLSEGDLTADVANNFMSVVDDAMTQLNTVRSDFGSTQNQLSAATRNMMVTQVNIKAAESIIRDVDYAAESANFNKQNIIAQAGTYAMSQANQVQQNIMRLLQ